jgi:Flp pilus assembly pilin Flp
MSKLKSFAKRLWADESAQGMLEYVLLAVAIVTIIALFKGKLTSWFNTSAGQIESKVGEITE